MTRACGTVLAYHAIGDCRSDPHNLFVPIERFARQMRYLARVHRVVPLEEVVRGTAPARSVALTFDDAYVSVFTDAAEIMARHGFPATVFVPTAYIGLRNRWDPPSSCPLDIATAEMLATAEARGLSVQSHGHAHIDMSSASAEAIREDLVRSVRILTDVVGDEPRFLAYPYRTGSQAARAVVEELGFTAAFSIDHPHEGRFAYERVQVTPRDDRALFALKASGRYISVRSSQFGRTTVALRQRLLRGRSSKR